MTTNIAATITICCQIGENTFMDRRCSKIFSTSESLDAILDWAENTGIKNPTINDIEFSEHMK